MSHPPLLKRRHPPACCSQRRCVVQQQRWWLGCWHTVSLCNRVARWSTTGMLICDHPPGLPCTHNRHIILSAMAPYSILKD
jgi:hypothetical protein